MSGEGGPTSCQSAVFLPGLAGVSVLGFAWGVHVWATGEHDRPVGKMIVAGAIAGISFTTVAMGELVWRLRHGPQEPGRHANLD